MTVLVDLDNKLPVTTTVCTTVDRRRHASLLHLPDSCRNIAQLSLPRTLLEEVKTAFLCYHYASTQALLSASWRFSAQTLLASDYAMYQGRRRTLRFSRGLSVVAFARRQRLLWRRKYACRVEGGGLSCCVSASVISARRGDLPSLGFGVLDTASHLVSSSCRVSTIELL